jgi:hypothetical protein
MREFQEGFLRGPPPLGPGAPAGQRLEAFADALIVLLAEDVELVKAADRAAGGGPPGPLGTLALHARHLLSELDPEMPEPDALAIMLLGALAAAVLHASDQGPIDIAAIQRAAGTLLHGILAAAEARKAVGTRR